MQIDEEEEEQEQEQEQKQEDSKSAFPPYRFKIFHQLS
jgi:hypothetical protein